MIFRYIQPFEMLCWQVVEVQSTIDSWSSLSIFISDDILFFFSVCSKDGSKAQGSLSISWYSNISFTLNVCVKIGTYHVLIYSLCIHVYIYKSKSEFLMTGESK